MANVQFEKAFSAIANVVAFKESWKNGTGYFDNAVFDREINVISKSVDPNGRRMVLIPTMVGNVVVFERYLDGDVIVSNEPLSIKKLVAGLDVNTSLGEQELEFYLGTEWGVPHIGERIEEFMGFASKVHKK